MGVRTCLMINLLMRVSCSPYSHAHLGLLIARLRTSVGVHPRIYCIVRHTNQGIASSFPHRFPAGCCSGNRLLTVGLIRLATYMHDTSTCAHHLFVCQWVLVCHKHVETSVYGGSNRNFGIGTGMTWFLKIYHRCFGSCMLKQISLLTLLVIQRQGWC